MSTELSARIRASILDVADFPKPGIVFKDITPVLADGALFRDVTDHLAARLADKGITQIVGIESRGFLFGAPLATKLGVGLTLIRKPGKLPRKTRQVTYDLEYGTDTLAMHEDALGANDRVVLIDDVLATGGTAAAAATLIESTGATLVETDFLMELTFLPGREKFGARAIYSFVQY